MILRSNSVEILWHTFEVYFLFPHEKCFKSMCKIEKVFIQLTCFCLFLTLLLFSVISGLLQGTVFRLEAILTFAGEIIAQRVMQFIHAAQLGPAFNILFISTPLHPYALPIKAHTAFWNWAHSKKFLTSFLTKVKKK